MPDLIVSSSLAQSRADVANHRQAMSKRHGRLISDCESNALQGRQSGYFVTLNTKTVFDDLSDTVYVQTEVDGLERKLAMLVNRLNGFFYRRRKACRLRVLGGIEIGKYKKRLHAHLIITHDNDVSRSFEQVQREIVKQWQHVYQFDESGFVKVTQLDELEGSIRYVTKDIEQMMKRHQVGSVRSY